MTQSAKSQLDGRDVEVLLVPMPVAPDRLRDLRALAHARGWRVGLVLESGAGRRPCGAEWQVTVGDVPVLLLPAGGRAASPRLKRVVDLAAAAVLALVTAPIWLAIAAVIPLDSPGPALFVHERVGRDGRRFRVWKFRTMRADAPPYARSPGDADPKVTRVGRLLRPAGLDEIPQLINVFRGEMSLVGPRPEMPFIADRYTAAERERLRVPPGITGVWQLCGDRARPMHDQLEYDVFYIACASLALDARVVAHTAGHALRALTRRAARAPAAGTPVAARAEHERA